MNKNILHWSYRDFKTIPEDLQQYNESLEEVYLKQNFISFIPQWLFELKSLKFIHLAGNLLKNIPEEIHLLENLEFLDVSDNFIRTLPPTIGKLTNLHRFNIGGNLLEWLPETIGQLKQLEVLNVSGNMISSLPVEIGHCLNLVEIVLSDNPYLQAIPEIISSLPQLEKFCADRCGLLYLPGLLSESIIHLRIFNNKFLRHIPMIYEKFFINYYEIYTYPASKSLTELYVSCSIKVKETESILRLPGGTRRMLNLSAQNPFRLFEYCLRAIHNSAKSGILFHIENLPVILQNYIKSGPLAECSKMFCNQLLFSEYYLVVVKRCHGNFLFTCNFCSCNCALQWISENKTKYNAIEWEDI